MGMPHGQVLARLKSELALASSRVACFESGGSVLLQDPPVRDPMIHRYHPMFSLRLMCRLLHFPLLGIIPGSTDL